MTIRPDIGWREPAEVQMFAGVIGMDDGRKIWVS